MFFTSKASKLRTSPEPEVFILHSLRVVCADDNRLVVFRDQYDVEIDQRAVFKSGACSTRCAKRAPERERERERERESLYVSSNIQQ